MAGGLMPDLAFLARHPVLRRLLLPAAAVIAFGIFLLVTFPYDVLARRIEIEAQRSGADLTIGSLGPAGLGGVRARDVKLRLNPAPGADALPELRFDRMDVSPDLFALLLRRTSFGFAAQGYGGTARGHVALSNDPKQPGLSALRIDARDIDLHSLPLKDMAGIEATGKLQLKADLSSLVPAETAGGSLSLSLEGAAFSGGTVQGFPVPKTALGHVDGSVTVEKGVARVEKTSARGGDLDADLDGSVNLRPLLSLSQADLHVRFRFSEKWLNDNAMIKGAMGLIQNARQGDGSYAFTFTGPLARMTPRPGR
ncbi:MAG: type II secretion system protein GspN [Myxococcales bacterium]